MPAKLDWRIEDEDFSPTDDLPPPERRSGWARWGRWALFLSLVLALGLGALWGYVRREQRKVEQELREVVELELAALRQGDRELFLSFQAPSGSSWRETQADLFVAYQAWAERQTWLGYWVSPWADAPPAYTGDVGRVSVSGKEGWAQVGVECPKAEGLCWQTWPYRWFGGVWRHAPIDRAWMGEPQELETAHLHLVYAERDEPAARELAAEMEAWYARLAPLYGLDPSAPTAPQVTVEFAFHAYVDANTSFRLDYKRPYRISGPALEQALRTQDGGLSHETRRQLATLLAEALIADGAGLTRPRYERLPVETWALSRELRDWALEVLDIPPAPGAPGTPLLDALVAQHGRQAVGRLVEGLDRWGTLDQALAASQLPLADSTRIFAFLIEAKHRLEWGDNTPHREALDDPQAEPRVWLFPSQEVTIQSVSFREDLAWVEVESLAPAILWPKLSDDPQGPLGPDDLIRQRRTLFFRRADGRWLYTGPDPAYFGPRQEERSANLVLGYHPRDARWHQGLTETLQPVLEGAAADLGIEPGGLVLTVEVGILPPDYDRNTFYQNRTVYSLSPHLSGWNESYPSQRWLAFDYSESLLYLLMDAKVSIRLGSSLRLLYNAVLEWELAQLFPEETARSRQLQMPLRDPERFDELEFQSDYYSLVAYLVEAYGPETLPRMLASLDDSDDLDGWLRQVTGGDGVAEVEPAWQAWVTQREGGE